MEWQPIETAPKDGTEIILYGDGRVTSGNWVPERWPTAPEYHGATGEYLGQFETGQCLEAYWTSNDGGFTGQHPPTHWMPRPPPPKVVMMTAEKAAAATLEHLGYTYCGGLVWKPPLGKRRERIDCPPTIAQSIRDSAINWPQFLGDVECGMLHAFSDWCEWEVAMLYGNAEKKIQCRTFMLFVAEALE